MTMMYMVVFGGKILENVKGKEGKKCVLFLGLNCMQLSVSTVDSMQQYYGLVKCLLREDMVTIVTATDARVWPLLYCRHDNCRSINESHNADSCFSDNTDFILTAQTLMVKHDKADDPIQHDESRSIT